MAEKGRETASCRAGGMSVYECLETTPSSFPLVFRDHPPDSSSPRPVTIPFFHPSMEGPDPDAEHFIYVTQVYFCGT